MSSRILGRLIIASAAGAMLLLSSAAPASAHTAVSPPAAPRTPSAATRMVVSKNGMACPVGPARDVTNSFGDPRGGGRRHQGIDIMASYGTPVYAIESGTIVKAYTNRRGGLSIFLRGRSGVQYFYAHQSANLVVTGQTVGAGQLIGRVGTSGNARGSAPHVHFEKLVGGRRPIDPFGLVKATCG
ncbi:MAG: M23 family metallopeptidase [Mycobacteriales bacterium]